MPLRLAKTFWHIYASVGLWYWQSFFLRSSWPWSQKILIEAALFNKQIDNFKFMTKFSKHFGVEKRLHTKRRRIPLKRFYHKLSFLYAFKYVHLDCKRLDITSGRIYAFCAYSNFFKSVDELDLKSVGLLISKFWPIQNFVRNVPPVNLN